jgi:hypothetical protein
MADYYQHFAFLIPVAGSFDWYDELTRLIATAEELRGLIATPDEAPGDYPFGDPADDGYVGALPVVKRTHEGLFVHDNRGDSCLETTMRLVRWVLNQPGTPDSVTFEYSSACHKPCRDGFSGGAIKVTADAEAWIHTSDNAVEDLLDQIIGGEPRARHLTRPGPAHRRPGRDAGGSGGP